MITRDQRTQPPARKHRVREKRAYSKCPEQRRKREPFGGHTRRIQLIAQASERRRSGRFLRVLQSADLFHRPEWLRLVSVCHRAEGDE
jgi:hypothetical protein